MDSKRYPPPDETQELTRQLEMLVQGLSVTGGDSPAGVEPGKPKRRSLDDMRRLSDHIKAVPVYKRK